MDKKNDIIESIDAQGDIADGTSTVIYIDPKKEAAALAKFDKTVLPVSVIFLILSSLDRNNVCRFMVAIIFPSCMS